ncbi:hypothetical protein ABS768_01425 [Flavobacterium sp. ST-75]|uniref:Uncharacterized protein n=1 Tax=Flavobacterium rhizophilum TaxID=3163296 RepID=A0ABW8Y9F8_9FLAO
MTELTHLTKIESELLNILSQVRKEWYIDKTLKGDKNWTYRIKQLISGLGETYGYQVCTSGFDGYSREWLYDLVWFKSNAENSLQTVPLVMECEWNRNFKEIKYDFEKLLLSNSDYRLMICQTNTNNLFELKSYFKNAVQGYELLKQGDRFLVAILDDLISGDFHFELIVKE